MLKLHFSLTRRPELSRAAFQTYWRETHAPLVAQAAPALGILRYVQSHSMTTALDAARATGRGLDPGLYDGHAELWWESEASLIAAMATPDGAAAGQMLLEDEMTFIDFSRSRMVFAQEHVVLG